MGSSDCCREGLQAGRSAEGAQGAYVEGWGEEAWGGRTVKKELQRKGVRRRWNSSFPRALWGHTNPKHGPPGLSERLLSSLISTRATLCHQQVPCSLLLCAAHQLVYLSRSTWLGGREYCSNILAFLPAWEAHSHIAGAAFRKWGLSSIQGMWRKLEEDAEKK